MTEQTYSTVQRRRSGAVSPPPWKPMGIYTEFSDEIKTELGDDGFNDLTNFVKTAVDRLKGMIKVQSPGEINVNLKECKGQEGFEKIQNNDYAFFITLFTQGCGEMTLAAAMACDTEELKVDTSTEKVYHSYENEYNKNNGNLQHFFGRPVAGRIEICAGEFKKRKPQVDDELWISTIMHEMTHALVFSPVLFANFLKRKGNSFQLYDKGQIEFKQQEKGMFEIPGIVKMVERDWKTQGGMRKHPVYLVITPEVTKQAREHFDCPTLEGGELENQGGSGSAMAHWEMRIYEHDTMAATSSQYNAFSKITLALFADSGWYEVDYDKADPVAFGLKKGCKFVKTSCGEWVETNSADSYPYCKSDEVRCSEDHIQIEQCNAFGNAQYPDINQTEEYTYFQLDKMNRNTPNGFPMAFADYCPYYALHRMADRNGKERDGKCTLAVDEQSESQNISLQMFSKTARCFQLKKDDKQEFHVRISTNTPAGIRGEGRFISHGCFEHKCEQGSVWVKTAKGEFNRCSKEGEEVKVKTEIGDSSEEKTGEFTIICPRYENICENNGRRNGNGGNGQRVQAKTTEKSKDEGAKTTGRSGDEGAKTTGWSGDEEDKTTARNGDEGARQGGQGTTTARSGDGQEQGIRRNSTKTPERVGDTESPDNVFVSTNSASAVTVLSSFVVMILL